MRTTKRVTTDQPKVVVPDNFTTVLAEVSDPSMSTDYLTIVGRLFRVQVLPIALEDKIVSLALRMAENYELMILRSVQEIGVFYDARLTLQWADSATIEECEAFYVAHLKKLELNDVVKLVVYQVINAIKWKPVDEKRKEEQKRYALADMFDPTLVYQSIFDKAPSWDIRTKCTSGLLEVIKLNNMISNDQLKTSPTDSDKDGHSERMGNARTMEEYLAGLEAQGVDARNLF